MPLEEKLNFKNLKPFGPFQEVLFVARPNVPSLDIRDFQLDIPPYVSGVLVPHLPDDVSPKILYIGDPDALNYLMHLHNHPKAYASSFDSPPYDSNAIKLTCSRLRFGFEIGEDCVYLQIGRGYARTPNCHH